MLAAISLIIGFLAWGAHAVVPWDLSRLEDSRQKAWALAAMPLLLAAVISTMLRLRAAPDAAVEQGLTGVLGASSLATITGLAVAILLAIDLIVALGSDRIEEKGWMAAGGLGVFVLILVSLAGERLRMGIGPGTLGPAFMAATTVRAAVSVAAGEIFAVRRPVFAPWAGLSLPCYALFLPASLRVATLESGLVWTSLAAGILIFSARFLPTRWQRIVLFAGIVLAGLFLARIAGLSDQLGRLPTSALPSLLPP